jgi:putative membrane protein
MRHRPNHPEEPPFPTAVTDGGTKPVQREHEDNHVDATDSTSTADTTEPDARFLLANERTLLAWVRTALTLQAAGIGVLQFVTRVEAREGIGLGLLTLGAVTGLVGYRRYRNADRALRRGQLPPAGIAPQLVALAVVALSVVLVTAYLVAELTGS